MIAEPRHRALIERSAASALICSACRSELVDIPHKGHTCESCGRFYPDIEGIPDLRLASDRYLSLEQDRAKAQKLVALGDRMDFESLAQAYYGMTDDVDRSQAERFLAHLKNCEARSTAFLRFLPKYGRVLEVGCGSGGMVAAAAREGIEIEGCDIASRWLVIARARLQESNLAVRLAAANAESLPWSDESFEAVYLDSTIEHLGNPVAALQECRRVTKPGGRLILISPNRHWLGVDPHVGLMALGWLPRRWQAPYVRLRRARPWPLQLRSPREARRLAIQAGWKVKRVGPAPFPGTATPSSFIRRLYESLRSAPITRGILKQIGPLWLLEAVREEPA